MLRNFFMNGLLCENVFQRRYMARLEAVNMTIDNKNVTKGVQESFESLSSSGMTAMAAFYLSLGSTEALFTFRLRNVCKKNCRKTKISHRDAFS